MVLEYLQLEDMTLRQLRRIASEYRISRYSRLRKSQLLAAVRHAERERPRATTLPPEAAQVAAEAAKYNLGSRDPALATALGSVDAGLSELPAAYEDSRVVLMPRDPYLCYAYWDLPSASQTLLRREGRSLLLRLYEVNARAAAGSELLGNMQEHDCDLEARELYLPVPLSDRDYCAEIGYHASDGAWVAIARSATVRVPPIYPSPWVEDCFVTLDWDRELQVQAVPALEPPQALASTATGPHLLASPFAGIELSQQVAASLLAYASASELPTLQRLSSEVGIELVVGR